MRMKPGNGQDGVAAVRDSGVLSIPPNTAPGQYAVSIVIYHPDTQAPLTAAGVPEIPLGTVQVE
jgi:hypothetical protein